MLYNVWLSLACTPGLETFKKLLDKFQTAENIYNAEDSAVAACIGAKARDYESLIDKSTEKAKKVLDFCTSRGVGILTYFDNNFPSSLREIKNPPVLLYYRGRLPDFDNEFAVSIVGTRRISPYGRRNTFLIAKDLAYAGALVVSGMAIGVDGVAHAGALAAGAATVAVIGSGIDVCYPIQHKRLAREIVKGGCVLTEYAPGTQPERFNFPTRNRIISGLSKATLVMEGSERSGALITARHAAEQGRSVYAFPGNVGNNNSQASNLLIKNGARLFTSADDIVREFEIKSGGHLNPFKLAESPRVDMEAVLRNLEVSCVSAEDDVFRPANLRRRTRSATTVKNHEQQVTVQDDNANEDRISSGFDKSHLALYKKIPLGSDCSIDSLIDDVHSLRDVMQGLLKLEVSGFVKMLPGDRVKRNI